MTPGDMAALHGFCFTTPRPWTAPEFAAFLADPLSFALTGPEAFLIARSVADEAEVLTLAVAPQSRRRGLGMRLMTGFLYQARLRGATRAVLEVSAENPAAIHLYSKVGFATAGRRPRYYHTAEGRQIDALILARDLI